MALLTEPNIGTTRGKREDLANLISLVDARETPVTSMAKKGSKPGNTLFRWQADSLPSPTAGGIVDGVDVAATGGAPVDNYTVGFRQELGNYIEVFDRAVGVSRLTEDGIVIAGVKDALAYEVEKGIKGLKRDMEIAVCSNQIARADTGSQGYLTAGLQTWIQNGGGSAVDIESGGTGVPTIPVFAQTAAAAIVGAGVAASTLTDTMVQDQMKAIYDTTGKITNYDGVVGTTLKRAFTSLISTTAVTVAAGTANDTFGATKVQTFNRNADEAKYIQCIDIFQGDFGMIRLHPTTFIGTVGTTASTFSNGLPTATERAAGTGYVATAFKGLLLDMSVVELRYGGDVAAVTALPDSGAGPRRLVHAVAGLVVGNPSALGKYNFSS